MKSLIILSSLLFALGCANSSNSGTPSSPQPPQPPNQESKDDNHNKLPDRIECSQSNSNYQLVLILKSPQLQEGLTVFGLKKGASVIFKVASQTLIEKDNILKFIESPATSSSKEVELNLQTKTATLNNFRRTDLPEGSVFACQY